MKLRTFYKIYYEHRFKKANHILKLYILIVVPIKYFINLIYLPKIINLDKFEDRFGLSETSDLGKLFDFLSRAWLPIFVLGWNATAFALQTVRALMLDENDKLYVMAARARGISGMSLLWRYPAKHSLGPVINSIGFDLNRIFSALPIVALILILTEAGALLIEALARSNDQQLAGAIIFLLTATIVFVNFITDIILAIIDPRIRKGVMGGG